MKDPQRVIIQLRAASNLAAAAFGPVPAAPAVSIGQQPGVALDAAYSPVPLPVAYGTEANFDLGVGADFAGEQTYIVRASIEGGAEEAFLAAARADPQVVGVFVDAQIEPIGVVCPPGPIGTDYDVAARLLAARLGAEGYSGAGVKVAIVDTGVNLQYLALHGKRPGFDASLSWGPIPGQPLGAMPVGHGTMCAYDVCIAAPDCTLLDLPVLTSRTLGGSAMDGLLSDAIRAYSTLLTYMLRAAGPFQGDFLPRTLVVSNSWGMFHPSWDRPVGEVGNYSDNPRHPFHRIVQSLEEAGADILFAAGNCGSECPDGRCQGVTNVGIYGANSSPYVTCVAGASVQGQRLGYSTKGPGRLDKQKPDITCYTHFAGSGVYAADGGTSAATPVAAGVVAAIRRRYPASVVSPARLRELLRQTATPASDPNSARPAGGTDDFNYDYGYGILNVEALLDALEREVPQLATNPAVAADLTQPAANAGDDSEAAAEWAAAEPPLPTEPDVTLAPRPWRVANALLTLRNQLNQRYPNRNKAYDGTIGDTAHSQRPSDHNPNIIDGQYGVVTALDITHDPAHGCDAGRLAQLLVNSRDPRIKYVIWNRRIINASPIGDAPAWTWRPYGGTNPHDHHMHLSVQADKARYDDATSWALSATA
ncbi:S8 family peptidase [Hymenobacter pini]|uniref:S8 family peptidase n=1 Tax=Hymenobacter pini TaxID=2880879 RepID=UPI001CF5909C|nr:S8/S53 family peptidase [Hymenobacter pini]MCA8832373.1 S8/S53 family peptidase [Hymenobacter pini]